MDRATDPPESVRATLAQTQQKTVLPESIHHQTVTERPALARRQPKRVFSCALNPRMARRQHGCDEELVGCRTVSLVSHRRCSHLLSPGRGFASLASNTVALGLPTRATCFPIPASMAAKPPCSPESGRWERLTNPGLRQRSQSSRCLTLGYANCRAVGPNTEIGGWHQMGVGWVAPNGSLNCWTVGPIVARRSPPSRPGWSCYEIANRQRSRTR